MFLQCDAYPVPDELPYIVISLGTDARVLIRACLTVFARSKLTAMVGGGLNMSSQREEEEFCSGSVEKFVYSATPAHCKKLSSCSGDVEAHCVHGIGKLR